MAEHTWWNEVVQGQFSVEQAFEPSSSTWEALILGIANESKVRTRQDYITLVVEG